MIFLFISLMLTLLCITALVVDIIRIKNVSDEEYYHTYYKYTTSLLTHGGIDSQKYKCLDGTAIILYLIFSIIPVLNIVVIAVFIYGLWENSNPSFVNWLNNYINTPSNKYKKDK